MGVHGFIGSWVHGNMDSHVHGIGHGFQTVGKFIHMGSLSYLFLQVWMEPLWCLGMGSKPFGNVMHMASLWYFFLRSLDGTTLGCLGMGSKRSMIQHIILPHNDLAQDDINITPHKGSPLCFGNATQGDPCIWIPCSNILYYLR